MAAFGHDASIPDTVMIAAVMASCHMEAAGHAEIGEVRELRRPCPISP